MPAWFKYTLLGLGGFLFFALTMVVAMNVIDQKLKPEVRAILDKPRGITEVQTKAYYYFLGALAGPDEGEEERGRGLWTQRKQAGFWADLRKDSPFGPELKDDARALKIYLRLIEFGEGATPYDSEDLAIISGLPYSAHKLLMAQMKDWLDKGGQLRVADVILASNRYAGSFLRTGNLIERVIATVIIRSNAMFVAETLKSHPRFPVTQDLIDSFNFSRTEDILYGALDEELRSVNQMVRLLESGEGAQLEYTRGIPTRLLLRPHETLNRYYDIASQALSSDCTAVKELAECVPAARWTEFRQPWNYLQNPVGRALVGMTTVSIGGIRQKIEERRADIIAAQESMRLSF